MSLRKFVAVASVALVSASLLMVSPVNATQPKKVKAPYALSQIDRNGDRNISNREWDWAEKRGYDRLTRNGNRVTRKTYQAYVNRYYTYAGWRQNGQRGENRWGWGSHRSGAFVPWGLGHQ